MEEIVVPAINALSISVKENLSSSLKHKAALGAIF